MSVGFTNIELLKDEFEAISKTVYQHCGIHLQDRKRDLVRSRLAKRVNDTGCSSYAEYLSYVMKDENQAEFTTFIDKISTNLTSFFREADHFDYLGQELIPSLLNASPNSSRIKIRGWSAGCSSGEEAYTIAATLTETIPNISSADVKLLASDISTAVLARARKGCYPVERLDGVSPSIRNKYFSLCSEGENKYFKVKDHIRRMIAFKNINLMKPWPVKAQLDFIFCRNVMIYFDRSTQQKLVQRFWEQLKPGGILFIAHSESLSPIQHKFKYVCPAVYQRTREDG